MAFKRRRDKIWQNVLNLSLPTRIVMEYQLILNLQQLKMNTRLEDGKNNKEQDPCPKNTKNNEQSDLKKTMSDDFTLVRKERQKQWTVLPF